MAVPKGVSHYGAPITLDQAKKVMAAAEAKAIQNNWYVAISIVDSGGNPVMLHRLDGTQLASIRIAEGKALTAVEFRHQFLRLHNCRSCSKKTPPRTISSERVTRNSVYPV
jgi:uncharacterized protein GlcG (DUF336 family)